MSRSIVSKFGGSSVADAGQIEKVRNIVASNPNRRNIVVSAPGKDPLYREKITDHLINIATDGDHFRNTRKVPTVAQSREAVLGKFRSLMKDLAVQDAFPLEELRDDLEKGHEIKNLHQKTAFYASRGERYNAMLITSYFASKGMNARACLPEDFGFILNGNALDGKVQPESHDNILKIQDETSINIIPGFYGITEDGEIAILSRGGSDLTAGEVAFAVNAEKYENWTDTNGVYEADPRFIPGARVIPRLTFKEIRLLSCRGFNVFHFDAMISCKKNKIPINIRNTNRPDEKGTLILNERVPEEGVVGIAKLDNMAYVYLEKDLLGEMIGFTAELLKIFQEYNINTYHYPTDKDDIAVLVNQDDLVGIINDLRRDIEKKLNPDYMNVVYNQAVITAVGLGLKGDSFTVMEAISVLGEHHIPIEMIDQSPSQICFHIGLQQAVADEAIKILHDHLLNGKT
ncbi:MAG: aspartate kinase [Deltaproteobacteria bacterium]|nr:aspartate kinase [Deltaproteobacteria bacterium]